MHPVRVAVQQRHRFFREGLLGLLAGDEHIEVTGVVATGDELVAHCRARRPDAAVVDIDPAARDAARVAGRIFAAGHRPPLLVGLYATLTPVAAATARMAGLRVLVPRAGGVGPLVRALRGEAIAAPGITAAPAKAAPAAAAATGHHSRSVHPTGPLTAREADVLAFVGAGRTSRQIAVALNISPKTVENHKQRIFGKLGVQSQAHAVAVALHGGLLEPQRVILLAQAE